MAYRLKTDWVLFLTTLGMVCFGLVMVYSASSLIAEIRYHRPSWHFVARQACFAAVGFGLMMLFKRKDYRTLQKPGWAFASIGVVVTMLLLVYFIDSRAHRWLYIGPFGLQPSEFAKPALIIFLAYFITQRAQVINSRYTILPAALALALLAAVVVIADLGTAVVLVITAACVMYVAGMRKAVFAYAGLLACVLALVAIAMKPYRIERIRAYVDPEFKLLDRIDPQGHIKEYLRKSTAQRDSTYHARQSKITVGSGGALGLGLTLGKQKAGYLPEAHTDFIYAVIGEELGFWGCTAVLCCFMVILWRGCNVFWLANDDFGRYLALGITVSVVAQAFINMGVVLDLFPTKGIPLPLISYGGSSLLSTLMSMGILLNVSEQAA